MKLDRIIKLLFIIIALMLIVVSLFTYRVYSGLCSSDEDFKAVEYIQSKDIYSVCGSNFGIVNNGEDPINVTILEVNDENSDVTSETIGDVTSEVDKVEIAGGTSYPIEANSNLIYKIENSSGSNLEHNISLRKF